MAKKYMQDTLERRPSNASPSSNMDRGLHQGPSGNYMQPLKEQQRSTQTRTQRRGTSAIETVLKKDNLYDRAVAERATKAAVKNANKNKDMTTLWKAFNKKAVNQEKNGIGSKKKR
jgi:monoamine oxidase